MANVQHKDIVDPNVHEPKGIVFAPLGSAYVSNGDGSGSWQEVLTPGGLGITPSAVFTLDKDIGSTEYSSGFVFPGPWSTSVSWGDVRVNPSSGFLQVNRSGIYLVSASYKITYEHWAANLPTIRPTRTAGALTNFQASFFPSIKAINGNTVESILISGIAVQLSAGQGFGLWATVSSGKVSNTRVEALVQMTRLSDG